METPDPAPILAARLAEAAGFPLLPNLGYVAGPRVSYMAGCPGLPGWIFFHGPGFKLECYWGEEGDFRVLRYDCGRGREPTDGLGEADRALLRRLDDATEGMLGRGLARAGLPDLVAWIYPSPGPEDIPGGGGGGPPAPGKPGGRPGGRPP